MLTADLVSPVRPEAGLVPFHPDSKGLTIDNDGRYIHCTIISYMRLPITCVFFELHFPWPCIFALPVGFT